MSLPLEVSQKSAVYGIITFPYCFLILGYTAQKIKELFGLDKTIFFFDIESAKKSGYIINYEDCIGKLIPLTQETIKDLDLQYMITPTMSAPLSFLGWNPPFFAIPNSQEETSDVCRESENQMLPRSNKGDKKDVRVSEKDVRRVERWKKRCDILDLVKKNDNDGLGLTQLEIAEMCGVKKTSVNKISQLYTFNNNLSHDDLWEKKRGPAEDPFRTISENIYKELCSAMETISPTELDIPCASWTANAVRLFLEKKGCKVKLSYVYYFCEKMQITSKFATRKNPKENDDEISHFLNILFPKLCQNVIKNGIDLYFVDETHVSISHHKKGYSKVNRPTVCSYDDSLAHSNYSLISFIGLDGSIRIFTVSGNVDSTKFTECLEQFKKEKTDKKIYLIMDNFSAHKSYETMGWFLSNKKQFNFGYLPRYCPKMNVVEFFNNIFKQELNKTSAMTVEEMVEKSMCISDRYNSNSEKVKEVIKSLFLKEECSYIKRIYDQEKIKFEQNKAC